MERPSRVAQLYGYTVCLIAVIVSLVSLNSLIDNAFALSNPIQARESTFGMEASLTSFETYRATYRREAQFGPTPITVAANDSVSEPVLRARYEALRADRLARVTFEAKRGITTSGLSLLIALALFTIHWRWLRRDSNAVPRDLSGRTLTPP